MYRTLALLTMMTASLYAYPAQYEESLRKDYSQEYGDEMRFWFMIPEDIQRPCRITGTASVVARSADTVEIRASCSYADTLQYRMIKVSPETNTDFDDLTVAVSQGQCAFILPETTSGVRVYRLEHRGMVVNGRIGATR